MKILLWGAGIVAGLYLLACGLLAFNARGMLYHPVPRDPAVPHWVLQREDARVIISHNQRTSPQVVLYFGGNAEDVSQALPQLAQAFPGASIHAMHYRGYGGSEGSASEAALVGDAFALYEQATKDAQQVTLVGRSLGSGIAVQLAAAHKVQRLVLITPYDSIGDLGARMFPLFPTRWLLADHYDSWRHAGRIMAPTTVVIAGRDEVIPNDSSWRLVRHFPKGVVRVVVIDDADHNDVSTYPSFITALRGP